MHAKFPCLCCAAGLGLWKAQEEGKGNTSSQPSFLRSIIACVFTSSISKVLGDFCFQPENLQQLYPDIYPAVGPVGCDHHFS